VKLNSTDLRHLLQDLPGGLISLKYNNAMGRNSAGDFVYDFVEKNPKIKFRKNRKLFSKRFTKIFAKFLRNKLEEFAASFWIPGV